MQTISTRQFLDNFPKLSHAGETLVVTSHGKRIGTYIPDNAPPPEVDFMARLKTYCTGPSPITGAELLKGERHRR